MSKQITLYELIGLKRKNSVLKSVMINSNKNEVYSGCHIEVEAYDDTFVNATRYPSQQDRTCEAIENAIIKHQSKIKEFIGIELRTIDVMHYSTFGRPLQNMIHLDEKERNAYKNWVKG